MLARSIAQLVLVASLTSLTACAYGRFDAEGSERGDALGGSSCAEAVEACDSYAFSYCSRASACGFMSFDECVAGLEQGGWSCAFAEDQGGDMEECVEAVDAMTCDGFASGEAFKGTACDDATIEFGSDVCQANDDDDSSAGGGAGGELPDVSGNTCTCYTRVTPTECGYAIDGCYWVSNDTANPYSTDGYCGGTCFN